MKLPDLGRFLRGRREPAQGNDLAKLHAQFENREAVYVEDAMVVRVRVHDIRFDRRGISAQATPIPIPGLTDFDRSWPIQAHWDHFRFSDSYWYGKYTPWRLWFDQDTVDQVTQLYAQEPEEKPLLERWRAVRDQLREPHQR
jgi:hypothetical protein